MRSAYAGQPDWDMRQQVIQKAYEQVPEAKPVKVEKKELVTEQAEEWKPDYFDKIYIGLRTYIPSWIMLGLVLVGALTVVIWKFKREIRQGLLWVLKGKEKDGS